MLFLNLDCCADNSLCLHLCNLRIRYSKTASSVTHHRVELMQRSDNVLDILHRLALCVCELLDVCFLCRNELMERRIKESDCNRISFQSLVQCLEVALLIRQNLLKCCLSLLNGVRADHFAECSDSVLFKEHMLCTAETDTFCTKLSCFLCICRCVCICSYLQCSILVSPCHNSAELTSDLCINCRNLTIVNVTSCTVDRDEISLMVLFSCQCELLVLLVHRNVAASRYTACTHTTCNYRCVRCHTAADCKDTLRSLHTCDILWGCLKTYKDNLLASCIPVLSILCCKHNLTTCSTR